MAPPRSRSIRQKLTAITLVTCLIAVILAGASLLAHEVLTFQNSLVAELSSQARILGRLTRAALSFADRTEAELTLGEFRGQPNIEQAVLYRDGEVFAEYRKTPGIAPASPAEPIADSERISQGLVFVNRRIVFNEEAIGTVLLCSNQDQLRANIRHHALILIGVFALSTGVALLFAFRLHQSILHPIQVLTDTARAIAQVHDYSRRAEKVSNDETGELTDTFNRMLDRIGAQDSALRESEARYRVLFRSSPLPAWLFNAETARFLAVNEAALQHYGYSESEFLAMTVSDIQVEPEPRPTPSGTEPSPKGALLRRHRKKDGSVIDVEVSADAITYQDHSAWLVIANDVTARRQAEADLAQANRKLIETSRQAGMAEVATGVLHNVGNVLNSVNVSATVIRDRLRGSKIHSFRKAADLLKPHLPEAGPFVSQDPQGRLLPAYFVQLADHLGDEQNALIEEVTSLARNIEHIKEIVSMQQSFARVYGVKEPLDPVQLFEDAMHMNAASFEKRGFLVERHFEPTPHVIADRHKVLQILLNLIGNSRQALEQGGSQPKRLRLSVGLASPTHAFLEVADNGVGISQESLTRIFQLGFTTKRDGHGFGLHSGANAAREMGGALGVRSDGPGLGAAFRLELPLDPGPEAGAGTVAG